MSAQSDRRPRSLPVAAACAAFFAVQVATFRWGVVTFDTTVQYDQVLSGQYEDWHPPITAFIWRWIGGREFGTAPFLLLDCALYWTGFGLLAESLRRRIGGPAAIMVLAVALLPIPFGQMGAVLKDPLLAACCLCATGLLTTSSPDLLRCRSPNHELPSETTRTAFERMRSSDRQPSILRLLAAALLLVAGATRFNAVLAAAPLLSLCISPAQWRRPGAATLGSLAVALLVLVVATTLVTALLQPRRTEPIYSLVNYDLAGTSLHAGRSVYPAGADPGLALIAHCYSPRLFGAADHDRCEPVEDGLRRFSHASGVGAARLWAAGIMQAPLAYLHHRLGHFDRNQRWLVREIPDDAVYIASEGNPFGLQFHAGPTALLVRSAGMTMAFSPFGRAATWLAAAAGLCLLGLGGRLPPLALALAGSALLYGGGYALVSVADDMRYNLWAMLAAVLAWLLVAVEVDWRTLPVIRRRLALALPLGAAAAELIALAA